MIAVDTNVLVRIVTRDDKGQARRAVRALRGKPLFVAKTVLLETEWVLRHAYELDRLTVAQVFRRVLGYARAEVEDRPTVVDAVAAYADGFDFADALHLASGREADGFLTFDRRLARRAAGGGPGPKVVLLADKVESE